MPDTEIVVERTAEELRLTIRAPLSDLALAMPLAGLDADDRLDPQERAALEAYVKRHAALRSVEGTTYPIAIDAIAIVATRHSDVGNYRELDLRASSSVGGTKPLTLAYDGIIHRIANHRALVSSASGRPYGVIRYSLAVQDTNPVTLPAVEAMQPASLAREDRSWPFGWMALVTVVIAALAALARRRAGR